MAVVIGGHWRSLITLIRLIRLIIFIGLIRLDLKWRARLHSYMWMDGMDGWLSKVLGSLRAPSVLMICCDIS